MEDLEKVMRDKQKDEQRKKRAELILPVIENVMHKFLGIRIDDLNKDITDKLKKTPVSYFDADTTITFSKAKKRFKNMFLLSLLQKNYGNVSKAAKIAQVDRRSVHRLVKKIQIKKIRKELPKPKTIEKEYVTAAIGDVLDHYKKIIHPEKLKEMYSKAPSVSEDILKELPEEFIEPQLTLKEAEEEFEREYLKKALEENNFNVQQTAKKIKIRVETLYRKVSKLGIKIASS